MHVAGRLEVRIAKAAGWTDTETAGLLARVESVTSALPPTVIGADVSTRSLIIWLNDEPVFQNSYGLGWRGGRHVWLNPKLLRRALAEPGDIYHQGANKMPALTETDQMTYTLAHELGHCMDIPYAGVQHINGSLHPADNGLLSAGRIRKDFRVADLLKRVLAGAGGVDTAYGRSSPAEAYAEAFVEWVLGDRDNPVVRMFAEEFEWNL